MCSGFLALVRPNEAARMAALPAGSPPRDTREGSMHSGSQASDDIGNATIPSNILNIREGVMTQPIGILYEHPEWFKPLFATLDRRGLPYEPIHAESHRYDPSATSSPYSLVVNRVSAS